MSTTNAASALEAFVRLLHHARAGGQAKVDALLALSQRTLYVPRKLDGEAGYAPLVNENGDWAVPVFTSLQQLRAAAAHFGWLRADGTVQHEEVGARRAVHYAINEGASFLVIDAVAPHALEATRHELEPLVSSQNRSDTSGPFAGVGRISSSILEATRPSQRPPGAPPARSSSVPITAPVLPKRVTRASFAAPREGGPIGQRKPTVSFSRTSAPPQPATTRQSSSPPVQQGAVGSPLSSQPPARPLSSSPPLDRGRVAAIPAMPPLELDTAAQGAGLSPSAGAPPAAPLDLPDMGAGTLELDRGFAPPERRQPSRTKTDPLELGPLQPSVPTPLPPGALPDMPPAGAVTEEGVALEEAPSRPSRPSSAPAMRASAGTMPPDAANFGAGGSVEIRVLPDEPEEDLVAGLTAVLRKYPEVEWATLSLAVRGPGAPMPAVGLRVTESFRTNVAEILRELRACGREHAVGLDVLLLDDPELVRTARQLGEVFYPWRRKTRH